MTDTPLPADSNTRVRRMMTIRAAAHHLATFIGLSYYGGQVCAFICTLDPWHWAGIVGTGVALGFVLRAVLVARVVDRRDAAVQSRWQYIIDFAVLVAVGVGVMLYDSGRFGFPLGSGMKGIVAFATFAFFAAADLALSREYEIAVRLRGRGLPLEPEARYFSLPQRFAAFAVGCSLFVAAILALLVGRDLELAAETGAGTSYLEALRPIVREIGIVFAVLVVQIINLVASYARNLKYFFGRQTTAMRDVSRGHLDVHVPVSSADEFGIIARHTNEMIDALRARTERLETTQDATIVALASLAETRDNETGMHIRRTQAYMRVLADELSRDPRFTELDEQTILLLEKSAPLHDMGKVGVPDAILLKPGRLTSEEFEIMKRHPQIGADTLAGAEKGLGDNSFLKHAHDIALTHHEKWDGSGYPRGLKETEIPLSGRLMALADVYDALISKRVYKPAFPHEKAREIIRGGRGSHFDPDVVDAFLAVEERFVEIARQMADPENAGA